MGMRPAKDSRSEAIKLFSLIESINPAEAYAGFYLFGLNRQRPRFLNWNMAACPVLPPIRSNYYGPHAGKQKTDRRNIRGSTRQLRNGFSS